MKLRLNFFAFIFLSGIIANLSCKKEMPCEGCATKNNKAPIALAGLDQVITLPTDSILLDGKQSSDPDGIISSYLWTKISGPASFTIVQQTDSITTLKTLVVGTYQFELTVTDNGGLSAKDTLQVRVNTTASMNLPPVAIAGNDTTIQTDQSPCTSVPITFTLNGSSSYDPDGSISNYLWIGPTGIANPNSATTTITGVFQGTTSIILKVTDNSGAIGYDTVRISIIPANRPLINAQLVPFGILSQGGGPVAVATAGNKIVFAGGWNVSSTSTIGEATSRVDIYDIVTHNWSTAELSIARTNMAVAVSGNKIFFAGGGDTDGATWSIAYNNVDIYDALTNTWSIDSLSSPRSGVTGTAVGSKVFFAGGCCSNAVDIYDLATNSWSVATLSQERTAISAVTVNSKVYFAGGWWGNNTSSNRIDIYDNATTSWSTSSLVEPKSMMAGIAFSGKIYWAGGLSSLPVSSSKVEIKDVTTDISTQACLFQPNFNFSAVLKNNKIVFFTGEGAVKNKFDIYDPATNTWSIGVLNENISGASIISVNNTIYIAGGNVNNSIFNGIWKLEF
jgi:hypothetical protein